MHTLTYTPLTNVDMEKRVVIDNNLVKKETFGRETLFTMLDTKSGKTRQDKLMNISLYDDIVTINSVDCKPLHMLTK